MPAGKRYYIIEHQGVPVEVTTRWNRAVEIAKQLSSTKGQAAIIEAEALQQELTLDPPEGWPSYGDNPK